MAVKKPVISWRWSWQQGGWIVTGGHGLSQWRLELVHAHCSEEDLIKRISNRLGHWGGVRRWP